MVHVPALARFAFGWSFLFSALAAGTGAICLEGFLRATVPTKVTLDLSNWLQLGSKSVQFVADPVIAFVPPKIIKVKRRSFAKIEKKLEVSLAAPIRNLSAEEMIGLYRFLRTGKTEYVVQTSLPMIQKAERAPISSPRSPKSRQFAATIRMPSIKFTAPVDELHRGEVEPIIQLQAESLSALKNGMRGFNPQDLQNIQSAPPIELSIQAVDTQALKTLTPVYPTAIGPEPVKNSPIAVASTDSVMAIQSAPTTEEMNTQAAEYPVAIEAFAGDRPLDLVDVVELSKGPAGWKWVGKENFRTTYILNSDLSHSIPVMSKNTATFLEGLARPSSDDRETSEALDANGGIVWGILAPGTRVQLSGSLEGPLYVDSKLNRIDAGDLDELASDGLPVYFVFTHVQPGPHLLYLGRENSSGEFGSIAAVGLPSIEAASTFVNLAQKRSTEIVRGRILDGAAPLSDGIGEMKLRLLGLGDAGEASTRDDGSFVFTGVIRLGHHPLYLETRAADGAVHRYQLGRKREHDLFWFSHEALRSLVEPIRGEVLPETGLVVAAFPEIVSTHSRENIYPQLTSISEDIGKSWITYSLTAEGKPLPGSPLQTDSTRALSVRVPTGFFKFSLETTEQGEIWSEFIVTSPGVVNVIGPH